MLHKINLISLTVLKIIRLVFIEYRNLVRASLRIHFNSLLVTIYLVLKIIFIVIEMMRILS
jgi:hypothetical protein